MEKTDKTEVKSKRDLVLEKLRSKESDLNFDDEDAIYGKYLEHLEQLEQSDKTLKEYEEREQDFANLFASDPRSAAFVTDWKNGNDPIISFIRKFGTDIKDAIDDPERQEEIAEANKEFVERIIKEKEYEEKYSINIEATGKYLDELQEKEGLSDEAIDEIMDFLSNIVRDAVLGKYSPETIEMARKALNHDIDVATAAQEGEVKGRNSKIKETLRKNNKGDGVTTLSGSGGGTKPQREKRDLGVLAGYGDGYKTIMERGNIKRKPIKK